MCASPVAGAVLRLQRYTRAVHEQESHDTNAQASDCLNGTISAGAVSLICKEVLAGNLSCHFPQYGKPTYAGVKQAYRRRPIIRS